MSELIVETVGAESIQTHETESTPKYLEELGKFALFEGMSPMEEVESPYQVLREYMQRTMVERDEAIDAVIEAMERSGVRMPNDNRPIATLAFLGPTGTGKTKLAEVLSEALNRGKRSLIKVDCPQYSHGHEITGLIGSPPSFVGHDQEPVLSKRRVEGKRVVILFDEIEKGSPQLFNLMLGITGDGKITLNNGDVVNFRNAVVVMTSNLGAKEMSTDISKVSLGFGGRKEQADQNKLDQIALRKFKEYFTPEYINRINKMIVFPPLSEKGLGSVLDTHLETLNTQYEASLGARITLSEKSRDHFIDVARQQAHMGARPLIRAFEEDVQAVFGKYTLSNAIPEGTDMHVFRREEVPEQFRPEGESAFVFFKKHDSELRKYRKPVPVEETPKAEEQQAEAEWEKEHPV